MGLECPNRTFVPTSPSRYRTEEQSQAPLSLNPARQAVLRTRWKYCLAVARPGQGIPDRRIFEATCRQSQPPTAVCCSMQERQPAVSDANPIVGAEPQAQGRGPE